MRTRNQDMLANAIVWAAAVFTMIVLFTILGHILMRGLSSVSWEFLTEQPRKMGRQGGILTPILGTLLVTVVGIAIAAPIGVATAVYLTQYTHGTRVTWAMRRATETLAGIPSIIFGVFGFAFFVTYLRLGWSVLSGGLTLAMMVLPTIIRTSEEAILAVPAGYREASFALGANRAQTTALIMIPQAIPGIATGLILSIGRAVGETAAVMLTAGSSLLMPRSIMDPARTMSVHLYILASEGVSMERSYGTAVVLVLAILAVNLCAGVFRRRLVGRG